MAVDYILPMRSAIKIALKSDAGVGAWVPASSVYGGTVPAERPSPFIRVAQVIASPFRASGLDSSAFRVTIKAYSKGIPTLPAEDQVINIGSAIKNALDQQILAFPTGEKLTLEWVQTVPQIDGDDTSAWMTSVVFNADVSG